MKVTRFDPSSDLIIVKARIWGPAGKTPASLAVDTGSEHTVMALWSMLHSSAFDDHHAIPTTADITAMAHRSAPSGKRIFPDSELQLSQVREVIKEHDLAPMTITDDTTLIATSRISRGSCAR